MERIHVSAGAVTGPFIKAFLFHGNTDLRDLAAGFGKRRVKISSEIYDDSVLKFLRIKNDMHI